MRRNISGRLFMLACGVLVGTAMAQRDAPPLTPDQIERFEAYERYVRPGGQHERLAARAGSWVVRGRAWDEPGSTARQFDGISEMRMIMGGRYLHETIEGDAMGAPFHGMSVIGFDNAIDRYVKVRFDSMGTGIVRLEGIAREPAAAFALRGFTPDPRTGMHRSVRTEERMLDDDTLVVVQYEHDGEGREFTSRELTYVRRE